MAQTSQNTVSGIEISRIFQTTPDLNHRSIRSHLWNMGSTSESYPALFSPTVSPVFSGWLSSTVASLLTLGRSRAFDSPDCCIQHVHLHWRKGRWSPAHKCMTQQLPSRTSHDSITQYLAACTSMSEAPSHYVSHNCYLTLKEAWKHTLGWSEPQE